ncbi:unnamed protein product [Sympodiomycopsis kandeliae]
MSHSDSPQEHDTVKGGNTNTTPAYLQPNGSGGMDLNRQVSVTLTPQQFEELYLQPSIRSRSQGQLIKTLGNPTSLGIVCFILNLCPTSCLLMGFRGMTPTGQLALLGPYYSMGAIGMITAGILEWILGNTFPFLVFFTFGTFWLSLGIATDPVHAIQTSLAANPTDLYAPQACYLLFWAIYVFFLTVAAFRTNVVLVIILFCVAMTFLLLSAAYFYLAEQSMALGGNLLISGGAFGFTACMAGLYLLFDLILASTEFPFSLPLGDLSGFGKKKTTT